MVLGSTNRAYHLPRGIFISPVSAPLFDFSAFISHQMHSTLCAKKDSRRGEFSENLGGEFCMNFVAFPTVYPVPIEIPNPSRCSVGCLFSLQMEILLLRQPGSQAVITLLSKARSWCRFFLFFSVWMLLCDSQTLYPESYKMPKVYDLHWVK